MTKSLIILGSTGSIGESALRVVSSFPGEYRVQGLACRSNLKLLDRQIGEHGPLIVAVESDCASMADELNALKKKHPGVEFLTGTDGVAELASNESDILLSAISGAAGLRPTLAALGSAKRIALANKETLVMAGGLFMKMLRDRGTELVPVDSEHSAIFSLLDGKRREEVERIILTASGGSMRDCPLDDLDRVTPEMALAHPTWDMGSKITIDSATLMNKGLEVIEAHHLFGIDYDRSGWSCIRTASCIRWSRPLTGGFTLAGSARQLPDNERIRLSAKAQEPLREARPGKNRFAQVWPVRPAQIPGARPVHRCGKGRRNRARVHERGERGRG